jgi:hypothetical protein
MKPTRIPAALLAAVFGGAIYVALIHFRKGACCSGMFWVDTHSGFDQTGL